MSLVPFQELGKAIAYLNRKHPKYTHSIWFLRILQIEDRCTVNGVIAHGFHGTITQNESSLRTFFKIIRSYFYRPAKSTKIILTHGAHNWTSITDRNGRFSVATTRLDTQKLAFRLEATNQVIPILQDFPIHFKIEKSPYLIISDIDDTILVSYSISIIKKLRVLLSKSPSRRKTVQGTREAFQRFVDAGFPFSYVSRSELNLFYLITSFLRFHQLPVGPVFLRPYVTWRRILKSRKNHSFKIDEITNLLTQLEDQKVIFFGDDSQKDLQDFLFLAREFPTRVEAIFIRETGLKPVLQNLPPKGEALPDGPQLHYYNEFSDIAVPVESIIQNAAADI